ISVILRCRGIASKDIRVNFLVMVNYMTLVFKCQSVRLKTGLRLTDIYKKEIQHNTSVGSISYRSFAEWHSIGCKFIAIACGGSIYSLVLIAGLGLRVAVASMVGTVHLNLANMLRSPPQNSPQRSLIMEYIAPTIARMRLMHPIALDTMFSPALIARFTVSKSVDCTDLSASDCFFDAIIQNAFVPLRRSRHVWRSCIKPVPSDLDRIQVQALSHEEFYSSSRPYSPLLSDVEDDEIEHIVIKTSYDPLKPENQRLKAPQNKADNNIWSAKERSRAEAGERVRSIEGLKMKLAKLYHKGIKRTQDAYLRIPMHIIPNHHLELRNADGSLMAFVSTALPAHIRSTLEVNLLAALESPDLLVETDTQLHGSQTFQAMHLSWYNRHCTSGHKAPTNVQPWLLEKEGMRTNHSQVIPYLSKDLHQHRRIYHTISKLYEELFEWVRKLMETYLQEEFELLMEVAAVLPGNCSPPVSPFISLVININVRTKAH
ncbi:uncharacterized protein F5891DRAFT_921684, partial [Suillus fuscotomentosus]